MLPPYHGSFPSEQELLTKPLAGDTSLTEAVDTLVKRTKHYIESDGEVSVAKKKAGNSLTSAKKAVAGIERAHKELQLNLKNLKNALGGRFTGLGHPFHTTAGGRFSEKGHVHSSSAKKGRS
jgi:hypothetical protein